MGLDIDRLSTVQLVPLTPFSTDGTTVLTEAIGEFAGWMYDQGIRVFIPAAGTGEFHSLSVSEVVNCVKAVRQAVGTDALVIAPVGMGLSHALSIGRGAREIGADAVLVMPPVHPYLCDEGLQGYFDVLFDDIRLPFLAYKKGPYPSEELLKNLAESGRLVGVKYAVNDLDALHRFVEATRGKLRIYCGTAERFAPFYHLAGARGFTSGVSNLCPRLTLTIQRLLDEGHYERAMEIVRLIRPIEDYRARACDSYNISMLKIAVKITGRDFGPVRPPQRPINVCEEAEIRRLVEPILDSERNLADSSASR